MKIKEKLEDCIDGIKDLKDEIKQKMKKEGTIDDSFVSYRDKDGQELTQDIKAAILRCLKDADEMIHGKPKPSNLRK